jgi:hypothetical protein
MKIRAVWTVLLLTIVLATGRLTAQSDSAGITGRIVDASGAVVPAVGVMVRNDATGVKRDVSASDAGIYTVPLLPPGRYSITVQKDGFRPITRKAVELQTDQMARIDFVMEVGAVTETVTVTGEVPLLAQDTSSLGQVVDNSKIQSIPLNGRDPFRLVQLTPGVAASPGANGQFGDVPVNTNQDSDYSINGGQKHSTEIYVDGIPTTAGLFNSITAIPTVDSSQEFKVESNNLSAEWGRFSGGILNVSTKSGTNELHGSLFEYLRNSATDANDFFNNRAGKDKPPFRMNQFGFAGGGPVWLGKLYDGRNKTFFFGDYQGTRWSQGAVYTNTVPTDLQKQGDFSQTFNQQRQLVTIYDPVSTRPNPAQPGQSIRDPFAGNKIPSTRFDPVASKIMTYYPEPNTIGNAITNANNFISNEPAVVNEDQFSVRVDQNFSERYRMFARAGINETALIQPNYFHNVASPDSGAVGNTAFHYRTFAFGHTVTLSPRTLLDIRYGLSRWFQDRKTLSYGFDQTTLGIPPQTVAQYQIPVFPALTVAGYAGTAGNSFYHNGNDNHSLSGSVSSNIGKHALKAGGEVRLRRINLVVVSAGAGSYTFNTSFTAGPNPNQVANNTGNSIASLLLGTAASGNQTTSAGVALQNFYFAGYVADTIRVSPKLTLNLGLRYETESPYTDRHNELVWFDSGLASPAANRQFPNLTGGLRFAGINGQGRTVYAWDTNNFSPRIGLAWQALPKTVFRAGFGAVYAPLETSSSNTGSFATAGFSATTAFVGSLDGITPFNFLHNPFPGGLVTPSGSALGAATFLGQTASVWDPNPQTPYALQWNADVQRALPGSMLIDVAYSANRGIHLAQPRDIDALPPQNLALGTGLQTLVPNPFAGIITSGALAQPNVSRQQLLLPFPQFTDVTVMNSTSGNSIYHSLQLKAEKRFSKGVSFLVAYTAGKMIADANSSLAQFANSVTNTKVQNWYNLKAERSLSEFDVSQALAVTYVMELPFGPGRALGKSWRGLPARIIENWQLAGATSYRTGFPLQLTTTVAGGGNRPNSVGRSAQLPGGRSRQEQLTEWFDTTAFSQPAPFTFGNVARTLPDVRGPNQLNFDCALIKSVRVTERWRVMFRSEFFNLLNTAKFGQPNTAFNNVQFGQISSTVGLPRVLQFSLKVQF